MAVITLVKVRMTTPVFTTPVASTHPTLNCQTMSIRIANLRAFKALSLDHVTRPVAEIAAGTPLCPPLLRLPPPLGSAAHYQYPAQFRPVGLQGLENSSSGVERLLLSAISCQRLVCHLLRDEACQ